MAIDRTNLFVAQEEDIVIYNGRAILDEVIEYEYDDEDETLFDFPGYSSSYWNIYDSEERNRSIKSFTSQVTRNSNCQVINCSVSDMTFTNDGTYYYELGYIRSGYSVPLRFGRAIVR